MSGQLSFPLFYMCVSFSILRFYVCGLFCILVVCVCLCVFEFVCMVLARDLVTILKIKIIE